MNRITSILFLLFFTFSLQAQVLYVKADASGANNGTSWSDAYTDLQNAIATANYGTQIWVAVGTYKPTQGTDRNTYFELKNGVEIYGGFIGTETQLGERDYIHNESILSGDIGVEGDSLDNSYTIVYSLGTDENTILEGFTIRDGNANYIGDDALDTHPSKSGGGVYLSGEQADLRCQIKHCHLKNNHSDFRGGGLFIWSGPTSGSIRPNIFANEFTGNNSILGGGIFWIGGTYLQSELTLVDSLIFSNNNADKGGGIHIITRVNSALIKIRNCSFLENASGRGGGLHFVEESIENIGVEFENCDFIYNTSGEPGGGINYESLYNFTNLILRNCYFDHNRAGWTETFSDGGAISIEAYIDTPNPNAKLLIDNTIMTWNSGNYGGAVNSGIEGEILIEVKNSTFQYNSAAFSGGGIYSSDPNHILRVSNSYFEGNAANEATGGGIHVQSSDVEITNSIFKANIGKTGAGIRMINGNVTNCVFYENNAVQQGGGIRCNQANISNCIFWNNINFGLGPDIYNNSFPITLESCLFSAADCSEINYTNSNIDCGENSIFGIDPLFTNPTIGDFSTATNSIVRDAGDNTNYPTDITEDYFGNPRFEGSSIDIGAYEIPAVGISSAMSSAGDCQEESINNGSLDYEIVNGVTPLTLTIGDIEEISENTTGTITGLTGGSYDFIVTDAIGNSSTQSVFIPTLPQPTTSTELTSPTCNTFTNGVIVLSAAGETAPFTVLWDNGTDDFGQFGLGGGNYAYTLTDAFGCQSTGQQILTEPDPIVINGTTQNTLCEGSSTGQININPTGGTGMLNAAWSPNPNNETGYQLSNIPAGTYNVTVTDESQCAFSGQYVIDSGNTIEISAEITDAACNDATSGAITVTPITGTGEFNYLWSNEMSGATISGLAAGDYIVTATDGNGCSVTELYTVFAGAPITFSPSITDILCPGEENGAINLNAENTSGLTFTWSPNVNGQTGTILTNLAADVYFLTITDEEDCPTYAEYTISEPTNLSLTFFSTNPSCLGGADGTINLTASGGTSETVDDYNYQISPNLTETSNGIYTGATAGEYQVMVTDANGCTTENTVTLTPGETLIINGVVTDAACINEGSGSIDLDGEDADGASYTWSSNANGQTTNIITGLSADTYSVTVIDNMGCEGMSEFVVNEPTEIILSATAENVSCAAGNDGLINVSATGGTPLADCPYVYTASPELDAENCAVFSGASAGTYMITATDANGCQTEFSVDVIENEPLTATASVTNASCAGATDGSINLEISGGEEPYTIEGETENLGAGEYSVSITDINNCQFTSDFTIFENAGLTLNFNVIDVSCPGGSDGAVELNIEGGVPPYTIEGQTTNLSAGEYTISVSDMNSCGATESITVSQPNPLNFDFDIVNAETSSSADGSIFLDNMTGGTPPYDFNWENGEETEDLTNIIAGIYNLTILDANDCTYNFGFEVDYNTAVNNLTTLGWTIDLQPNILQEDQNTKLLIDADQNAKGQLKIYNSLGQLSTDITLNVLSGRQQFILSTENLSSGVYFVRVEMENLGTEILRLIIVD